MREASFQMSGPKLFNKLPIALRDLTKCGLDEFKKQLDQFLTFVPDQPKCSGLTPAAQLCIVTPYYTKWTGPGERGF